MKKQGISIKTLCVFGYSKDIHLESSLPSHSLTLIPFWPGTEAVPEHPMSPVQMVGQGSATHVNARSILGQF